MRRLAQLTLAATICCSAANVDAEQTRTASPALKSLLSQGWDKGQPAEKAETAAPEKSPEKATIVRPKPRVLEALSATTPSSDRGAGVTARPSPKSLAELINRSPKLSALKQESDAAAQNTDLAPSVNRLTVGTTVIGTAARSQEKSTSRSGVRAPKPASAAQRKPIQIEPVHAKPVDVKAELVQNEVVAATSIPTKPALSKPALSKPALSKPALTKPALTKPALTKPALTKPALTKPVLTKPVLSKPVQSEPTPTVQTEEVVAQAVPRTKTPSAVANKVTQPALIEAAGPGKPVPIKNAPTASNMSDTQAFKSLLSKADVTPRQKTARPASATKAIEREIAPPVLSDRLRRIASRDGFVPISLERLANEPVSEVHHSRAEPVRTTSPHAARLRTVAQESLRNAQHRLQRQATHSAKRHATDALRSIVAMRDAQVGGNRHMKQLQIAFDAIRESKDFGGQFGEIDLNALKRMVTVHETDVLKKRNLDDVSGLEATESYLAVARTNLVLAADGASEASDALVLLGQIEKQLSESGNPHGAAVAVSLQRAAIEIEPSNALGYRELGTTLLSQGLVDEAAWALNKSIDIYPTRSSYQRLLEASRRLGDVGTARVCLASLQDPHLRSEIPVKQLSSEQFAASYRPNPAAMKPMKTTTKSKSTHAVSKPTTRISSLNPFWRR